MDLQNYCNMLQHAEKSVDVNRYTRKGIRLWPIFRNQTIGIFKNPDNYYLASEKTVQSKIGIKERLLNIYCTNKFRKIFVDELHKSIARENIDIMLYSKYSTHTDQINGKWYDRFVDPYFEELNTIYSVKKIEISADQQVNKDVRSIDTIILDQNFFKDYFFYKQKNDTELNLDLLTEEISKVTGIKYVNAKVNSSFYEIIYHRDFFREVFKIIKPKFVFLKCYYENDSFGLILAAKEAGIKTVDIQHGKQGLYHPMYTHFTKIPKQGYELLPDYFWNWGEESAYNIENWQNNKISHKAIVGGNLWLAKWKHSDFYTYKSAEEADFVESFKKYNKVILYAIQPLAKELVFPEHIIKAIHNSPENWIWLLRVHPFQKLSENEILKLIGNPKVKVEIQHSTSLPIYHLLKYVSHHITLWSSTCFEANDFNIPTIISHEFGLKLYEEHISKNIFSYSVTTQEILSMIQEGKLNTKTNYIETEKVIIDKAFQAIDLPILHKTLFS